MGCYACVTRLMVAATPAVVKNEEGLDVVKYKLGIKQVQVYSEDIDGHMIVVLLMLVEPVAIS